MAGRAMRFPVAALNTLLAAPPLRHPVARVEHHVTALARVGNEWRRQDATRAGALVTRAEPVLARILERAVNLLPVEALLARIDVDALVRDVDVDALISRIDLPRVVADVLAGIELGDLIHDSTTSIATDARDTVRTQAMSLDRRLATLIDRILLRHRERDLFVPAFAVDGAT